MKKKSAKSTFGSVLYTRVDDGYNEEKPTDVLNDTIDEEKSTKSTSGTVIYSRVDDGENEEKPTDVFGDNVESLQRTAQPTGGNTAESCSLLIK